MRNKIITIEEKVPKVTTLPDGYYIGTWGGYVIELHYKEKTYQLKTEDGVRGINYKVIIYIENGIATFETVNN